MPSFGTTWEQVKAEHGLESGDVQNWRDAVVVMKAKAREFLNLQRAVAEYPRTGDPALERERETILTRAALAKTTLEKIDSGVNWILKQWDNINIPFFGQETNQQLGAFWIPVTAILGIVATLTVSINSMRQWLDKVETRNRLVKEGVSLPDAVKMTENPGLFDFSFGELATSKAFWIPVAVGAGVILLLTNR